jgi:hypothetical protein
MPLYLAPSDLLQPLWLIGIKVEIEVEIEVELEVVGELRLVPHNRWER